MSVMTSPGSGTVVDVVVVVGVDLRGGVDAAEAERLEAPHTIPLRSAGE